MGSNKNFYKVFISNNFYIFIYVERDTIYWIYIFKSYKRIH